ncbi:MAG: hypothetical protein V7603_4757 [Micromonosporaceae bacterium]|jgi:uncharacterized membrane protein HdeD (DUF308 family)
MENRQYGWLLALRGIIAIVFGFLALLWPGITVIALAVLFGAFVLVDGVGMLVSFFRRRVGGRYRGAHLVAGVGGVVAGILTLLWPGITVLALMVLIGAWAIVIGGLEIVAATEGRSEWYEGLIGGLSIVAGVLILLRPGISALAMAQVIGVFAIIIGGLRLAETWQLYRSAHRRGHDRMAPAGA